MKVVVLPSCCKPASGREERGRPIYFETDIDEQESGGRTGTPTDRLIRYTTQTDELTVGVSKHYADKFKGETS